MEAENGSLQEDCFLDHHVQLPCIFSVIIVIECNPSDAWPQTFIKLFWLSPQSSSPTSKGYPSKELGFKHPASANQWIWRNLGFWLIPQTIMATSQFQKPSFISLHHLFPTFWMVQFIKFDISGYLLYSCYLDVSTFDMVEKKNSRNHHQTSGTMT